MFYTAEPEILSSKFRRKRNDRDFKRTSSKIDNQLDWKDIKLYLNYFFPPG